MVCLCLLSVFICGFSVRVGKRHSSWDSVAPPSHSNRCWSHGRPWQEVSAALHQTHWSAHQPDGWMNDTNEKGALSSGQPAQDEWQSAGGRIDCLWTWKNSFSSLSQIFSPPFLFFKVQIPPKLWSIHSFLYAGVLFQLAKGVCVCGGQCGVWGVLNALLSEAECVSQLTGPVLFGAVNPSGRGRGKTGGVKKEREKSEGKRRGTCGCRERDSWEAYRRAWPHLKSKGSLAGHNYSTKLKWVIEYSAHGRITHSIQLQERIIWKV